MQPFDHNTPSLQTDKTDNGLMAYSEPLPIFDLFLLWPNGWMHQDATRYGGRLQPRRVCVRWGPSPSPKGGGVPFPILRVAVENFEIGPAVCGTTGYS